VDSVQDISDPVLVKDIEDPHQLEDPLLHPHEERDQSQCTHCDQRNAHEGKDLGVLSLVTDLLLLIEDEVL